VALSGDILYLTGYYKRSPGVGIWRRSAFPAGLPEKESHEERLRIRPNPAFDRIFISLEGEVCPGLPFFIMDINGQALMSGFTGDDGNIQVSDLCPGSFLVVIRFLSKQHTGHFIRK
jgi:hypothetical protein